jgi:hypothetical protein
MGATRLASGIKAIGLNKGSQTVLITLMSVSLALKSDAGRVAPISGSVLCLRLVVAGPLPYYNNFTCRVSYILH